MPRIAFLHPDLGIGGAERLIVDAAIALKKSGNSVLIFTSHHDKSHCFEETKNGQLEVITVGDMLPRTTFGRFYAFWAYFRMIYLSIYLVLNYKFDVIICDQISACIPVLKLFKQKCIFYCHFPDQLLTKRETLLKKIYRYPIDWFEEITTGLSDIVLVNSMFTAEVFRKTFSSLKHINPEVLYPTVNLSVFDKQLTGKLDIKLNNVETLFLSINRFERKKNLGLAIEALRELNCTKSISTSSAHLILAGGYDNINQENVEYFEELNHLIKKLGLENNVTLLKSPSDNQKQLLLHSCTAVIYTPENEHFGIVPLEAMYMSRPVIAANSGGPRETVIDNETGFLCNIDAKSFSEAMRKFVQDKSLSREMGAKGREHVVNKFNYKNFQTHLNNIVTSLLND